MAGIYIHIPFCKQKCYYCNFFSSASLKKKNELLHSLIKEIQIRRNFFNDEQIDTIYLGGGTPSLLDQKDILKIFYQIERNYTLSEIIEFTLEANPDDLTGEKLQMIKDTPVNRLSIGVQSFNNDDLKYLTRIHNAEQALKAVKSSVDNGFNNISVDLIYGIPGQTSSGWIHNLKILSEMSIPHISAYSLTVEPGTILGKQIEKNKIIPPDESSGVKHFKELIKYMDVRDYIHYEISNFCKEGYHSRHNCNYWSGEKYLGIGPSAHSFNGLQRQWNIASISKYIEHLTNKLIPFEQETLSAEQKFNEYLMVSLRTIKGCDPEYIKEKFGIRFYLHCMRESKKYIDSGHLRFEEGKFFLTLKGKLFADGIASELFYLE